MITTREIRILAVWFCLKKIPEPGRCLPGSGTDIFLD